MAERLDIFVKEKLNISRQKSAELIKLSSVIVNGKIINKPSFKVENTDNIDITDTDNVLKYVSRGGYKLEKALKCFNISLDNKWCMDIGASTGGFTDCMLKNGAEKVYACDVGSNQLVDSLKYDSRVISYENTDIRDLNIDEPVDFIGCDVSFISIEYIISDIKRFLSNDGEVVVLIKPQFEAGRSFINKNGIVKNPKVHKRVINDIINYSRKFKLYPYDVTFSPIKGGDGNIEYLLYLKSKEVSFNKNIELIIEEAFNELK